MTGFRPPHTMPLVWEHPGGGYCYLLREFPLGSPSFHWSMSWTGYLTNALHDAGWHVAQRRRLRSIA